MRDLLLLFVHWIVTLARLAKPGGLRSVVAQSVLVRHQLLVLNRGRKRASKLRTGDRIIAGLCTLFMRPARVVRSAIVVKPSTLLHLHAERALPAGIGFTGSFLAYLSRSHEGQLLELRFIPLRIGKAANPLGPRSDGPIYRRIIGFGIHNGIVDGVALCRMFNRALGGHNLPKYLSSDHDPLYRFHQCEANLRVLEIREIKTVPYVPCSHPFLERLIGTLRRKYLDRVLFWTTTDLPAKLFNFQHYYNWPSDACGAPGALPQPTVGEAVSPIGLDSYCRRRQCRGLYQTPIAA